MGIAKLPLSCPGKDFSGGEHQYCFTDCFFSLRHVSKTGEGKILRKVRLGGNRKEGNRVLEASSFISPNNTSPLPPRTTPGKQMTKIPSKKAKAQHLSWEPTKTARDCPRPIWPKLEKPDPVSATPARTEALRAGGRPCETHFPRAPNALASDDNIQGWVPHD